MKECFSVSNFNASQNTLSMFNIIILDEFKRNMMERDQSDHSWALINSLPPADSTVLESPVVPDRNVSTFQILGKENTIMD